MARSNPGAQGNSAHRLGAKAPLPEVEFAFRKDAKQLLEKWEPIVVKRSRKLAAAFGGKIEADDFEQEARLAIAQIPERVTDPPIKYVRRVLKNSSNALLRSERAQMRLLNPGRSLWTDHKKDTGNEERRMLVRVWINTLPPRLQEIYKLLYELRSDQETAAEILGITQQHVSRLKDDLLEAGRNELEPLLKLAAA